MKTIFRSLTFKIGILIVLAEIIVLAVVGVIYVNQFSEQIDARIQAQIQQPGALMNAGLLEPDAVNDPEVMREIIGEELAEAYVVGVANNNIFYSLDPEFIGVNIEEVGISSTLFAPEQAPTEPQVVTEDGENFLVSVTPIFGIQGRAPFLFTYVKVGTAQADAEKAEIRSLFALGSLATIAITSFIIILSFNFTIRTRISSLVEILKRVEGGDLTARTSQPISEDEIGTLQEGVNSMAAQLEELVSSLEERVAARTRDLQTAAEVSQQVTTVLDLDEMLREVVVLTNSNFGLYYTAIFLLDAETKTLIRTAGAYGTGQFERGAGTDIPVTAEPSLVAQAARERETVVVNDTNRAPTYLQQPFLPETRSEMAVPMVLGERLIGVIDVQSQEINRFDDNDQQVIRTLASQIAVAVQNARLFSEQVKVAEELRTVDTMKSQFMASMSHELRTPLNAILNFTQFVSSGLMGTVNDKQVETLNKVVSSADHLLALINDVLDITKIESGMMELFVEDDVNLNDELTTIVSTAESLVQNKPIAIITKIDDDLPQLAGDKRRIRQVILNLVSNAAKFTKEGSITISAQRQDDDIVITVADTGPGLAPADQELIFEPFRQTQSGLKQGAGTGLGLAISRRLAEAHEGNLWLESTPGQGATFYVKLPVYSQRLHQMVEVFE